MMPNSQAVLTNLNSSQVIKRDRTATKSPNSRPISPANDRSRIQSPTMIQEIVTRYIVAPLMGMLIVQLPEDLGPGQGD